MARGLVLPAGTNLAFQGCCWHAQPLGGSGFGALCCNVVDSIVFFVSFYFLFRLNAEGPCGGWPGCFGVSRLGVDVCVMGWRYSITITVTYLACLVSISGARN